MMFFQNHKETLLDRDRRLKQKIDIVIIGDSLPKCFTLVKSRAKVILFTKELVLQDFSISIKDQELCDAMDAICSILTMRWVKINNDYALQTDSEWLKQAFIPGGSRERRFDNTRDFKSEMQKLPPELQKQLQTEKGIPVNMLPSKMLTAVEGIMDAYSEGLSDNGSGASPIDKNNILNSFVSLVKNKTNEYGINEYVFNFKNDIVSAGFAYNDYGEQLATKEKMRKLNPNMLDDEYVAKDNKPTQEEIKEISILKSKVKVKLRQVSMAEVMQFLARYYQVNYISHSDIHNVYPDIFAKKDIDLPEMSLKELMERLCNIYKSTYECRKTGILVVSIKPDPIDPSSPEGKRIFEEQKKATQEATRKIEEEEKRKIPPQ